MDELRRARDGASAADIVEVRLDGVDRPDPVGAVEGRLRPVIVTCRPKWEGGAFEGAEEDRRGLLLAAQAAGAEFVDVELHAAWAAELVRMKRGRGVIVSLHRFGAEAPGEFDDTMRELRSTGAEVVKLAVEVDSLTGTLPLFELGLRAERDAAEGQGHVLIAMGPRGAHTRVLAARLRNRWTYAGKGIAPGQLPPAHLLEKFLFRRIRPDADLYGVTGAPVTHSLSPAMHNAGFAHADLNAAYVSLEARDADDFVTFAQAIQLQGASVTAPLKVAMLDHVDDCDWLARRVGAMNTLVVRDGRWTGANTDLAGFLAPLERRMSLHGARAAVLGAGGAARAVAAALEAEGALVRVCARRPEQAAAVASELGVAAGAFPPGPGTWDILVNATASGTRVDDQSPMHGVPLDGELVYDLTYGPGVTPLIAQARRSGCGTIGGIEMLVGQAERQFELWTGAAPPPGLFRKAADAAAGWTTGVGA
jgi:3-dehydroquinate dehydratase/shikimate dehydrogenase